MTDAMRDAIYGIAEATGAANAVQSPAKPKRHESTGDIFPEHPAPDYRRMTDAEIIEYYDQNLTSMTLARLSDLTTKPIPELKRILMGV